MYISKIIIKNFRNLKDCEATLNSEQARNIVLIGETQSGKTNLIHALRLILDEKSKHFTELIEKKDFNVLNEVINIEIEITSPLEHKLSALLYDCLSYADHQKRIVSGKLGLVSRYDAEEDKIHTGYYTGNKPDDLDIKSSLPKDINLAFQIGYLEPLRDVEAELGNKLNSPLRWALKNIKHTSESEKLEFEKQAKNIDIYMKAVFKESAIISSINSNNESLIGLRHKVEYSLQNQDLDFEDAVRNSSINYNLKENPFPLERGSLGLNNALYLSLKRLLHTDSNFKKRVTSFSGDEIESIDPFVWLAIEEPEAHLHPQLQRQVYNNFVKNAGDLFATIVSTHSPHLVSISNPQNLLFLKRDNNGDTTINQFKGDELDSTQLAKLKNYLHVTRAEMVFASGVILVEGIAEKNLISAWYPELDGLGISICSVDSTDFSEYEAFLNSLAIPYVIITDWDPKQQKIITNKKTGKKSIVQGDQKQSVNSYLVKHINALVVYPYNIYTNEQGCTLEWELFQLDAYDAPLLEYIKLRKPDAFQKHFNKLKAISPLEFKKAWNSTEVSKGSLSQNLAVYIQQQTKDSGISYGACFEKYVPKYIIDAVSAIKTSVEAK
jgi:putative ATP-dependent endonuclease of OLD family